MLVEIMHSVMMVAAWRLFYQNIDCGGIDDDDDDCRAAVTVHVSLQQLYYCGVLGYESWCARAVVNAVIGGRRWESDWSQTGKCLTARLYMGLLWYEIVCESGSGRR